MSRPVVEHLGFVSLEPWDQVWRRNQYLVREFVEQGLIQRVTFLEPPSSRGSVRITEPHPGVRAVRPVLRLPKRLGGLRLLGSELRRGPLRDVDMLWINDAPLGRWCLSPRVPTVYDVTDDWRESECAPRIRRRLVAAEDHLAVRARTIVCSQVLFERWQQRYGVTAAIVRNAVDAGAWQRVTPVDLPGAGPHVGYVGTQHTERVDIDLLEQLAVDSAVGTLHLVGPDVLDVKSRARLDAAGVLRHGPIAASQVPAWMCAFDVLISPHVVSPFTLSLDAIKSHEYLAAKRPVVATPASGFQDLHDPGVLVVAPTDFIAAVRRALLGHVVPVSSPATWADRAQEAAVVLRAASARAGRR